MKIQDWKEKIKEVEDVFGETRDFKELILMVSQDLIEELTTDQLVSVIQSMRRAKRVSKC